jgi:hypothetical protein
LALMDEEEDDDEFEDSDVRTGIFLWIGRELRATTSTTIISQTRILLRRKYVYFITKKKNLRRRGTSRYLCT